MGYAVRSGAGGTACLFIELDGKEFAGVLRQWHKNAEAVALFVCETLNMRESLAEAVKEAERIRQSPDYDLVRLDDGPEWFRELAQKLESLGGAADDVLDLRDKAALMELQQDQRGGPVWIRAGKSVATATPPLPTDKE